MKIPSMRHPESEELLRYVDGEAPSRAANEIRSHLETCWECRVALEELQNTIGDCVQYRKNTLARHLPPPPAPWPDIYRGFAEIDAELDRVSWQDRLSRILQAPMRFSQRWIPVAAALIVVCVLFYRFRQTPSVQAAELLRKAIAAADSRPVKTRRIQVRTRNSSVVRLAGGPQKATGSPLEVMFASAQYDWDDPLSAKSYQAWRDRQAEIEDEVVEEQDAYTIRTRTTSGELAEATLKIRTHDLRPVEERFEFRNQEWVEISELADEPAQVAAVHAAADDAPSAAQPSSQASSATIGDELQVLAALREMDADLGDPIEVSRAGSQVLVTGVGIAPQRRKEIGDALSSQSRVVVRFSEAAPAVRAETTASADSTINVEIEQLQGRVAEQIGGRANFAQLAAQVLDLSEPMMSRAYALRLLAERVPVESESQLTDHDWQVLRNLEQEHTEALLRQTTEIDRALRPALAPVSGPVRTPNAAAFSNSWQTAAEELFQSARRVDKLVAVIFGAAARESTGEQLPAQLLSSLAELRSRVDAFRRLAVQGKAK